MQLVFQSFVKAEQHRGLALLTGGNGRNPKIRDRPANFDVL
jgi:hypothetical protein